MYTYVYLYICACIYLICIYVRLHVYINLYMYTYTYTYMYTLYIYTYTVYYMHIYDKYGKACSWVPGRDPGRAGPRPGPGRTRTGGTRIGGNPGRDPDQVGPGAIGNTSTKLFSFFSYDLLCAVGLYRFSGESRTILLRPSFWMFCVSWNI